MQNKMKLVFIIIISSYFIFFSEILFFIAYFRVKDLKNWFYENLIFFHWFIWRNFLIIFFVFFLIIFLKYSIIDLNILESFQQPIWAMEDEEKNKNKIQNKDDTIWDQIKLFFSRTGRLIYLSSYDTLNTLGLWDFVKNQCEDKYIEAELKNWEDYQDWKSRYGYQYNEYSIESRDLSEVAAKSEAKHEYDKLNSRIDDRRTTVLIIFVMFLGMGMVCYNMVFFVHLLEVFCFPSHEASQYILEGSPTPSWVDDSFKKDDKQKFSSSQQELKFSEQEKYTVEKWNQLNQWLRIVTGSIIIVGGIVYAISKLT